MEKKICSKCKIEKNVCEFGILKSSTDGLETFVKNVENQKKIKIKNIILTRLKSGG